MTSRKRLVFSYCCLALLLAVLFAVSLFWGSVALTPQAVLAALTGRGQDALSVGIITQLRLPRAVMAALLGAALSAAGYLLQTFFANPIAGPFVMGISSGAKLAVALVMVLFLNYGLLTSSAVLILAAFAGAMAAMAFVLAAAIGSLGGMYLSMGYNNFFIRNMTANRGFVGMAAATIGNGMPVGATVMSFFFGLAYAITNYLKPYIVDSYFLSALPFLLIIVLYFIVSAYRSMEEERRLKAARMKLAEVEASEQKAQAQ